MTAKFDFDASAKVRRSLLLFPSQLTGNEHPKDLRVKRIEVAEARGYIAEFHYSHLMPDSSRFCFAAYYGEELAGICVFGTGCGMNQYRALISNIPNGAYAELTRLWCFDKAPKNTESRFISLCLKLLPKEIKLVLSYADSSRGHEGVIYKATNWLYLGKTNGAKLLVDKKGKEFHPRLLEMYRKRHPDTYGKMDKQKLLKALKFKEVEGGVKHRYAKVINLPSDVQGKIQQAFLSDNIPVEL